METGLDRLKRTLVLTEDEEAGMDMVSPVIADNRSHPIFLLVGRLLTPKVFRYDVLKSTLMSIIKPVRGMEIRMIEDHRFALRFNHEVDRDRAIRGCPWVFDRNLIILRMVNDDENPATVELHWCPFYMHVHGLPIRLMSREVAESIASEAVAESGEEHRPRFSREHGEISGDARRGWNERGKEKIDVGGTNSAVQQGNQQSFSKLGRLHQSNPIEHSTELPSNQSSLPNNIQPIKIQPTLTTHKPVIQDPSHTHSPHTHSPYDRDPTQPKEGPIQFQILTRIQTQSHQPILPPTQPYQNKQSPIQPQKSKYDQHLQPSPPLLQNPNPSSDSTPGHSKPHQWNDRDGMQSTVSSPISGSPSSAKLDNESLFIVPIKVAAGQRGNRGGRGSRGRGGGGRRVKEMLKRKEGPPRGEPLAKKPMMQTSKSSQSVRNLDSFSLHLESGVNVGNGYGRILLNTNDVADNLYRQTVAKGDFIDRSDQFNIGCASSETAETF
ncbi:UNVERIFIED_CONTAM: hypothetical protein Sradi_0720500 [Sesamum radiatum]|uniref:DUF4283 domain-containing protein n=1 Tax=Sesamum radiatum TaxID=300843 RepID=A0AAW2VNC0_SESRA